MSNSALMSRSDIEKCCEGEDPQRIESIWTSLKGDDDAIDTSYFVHIANDDNEREALSLFICFGGGEMTKDLFIEYCLHAKLLSKKKFDRATAEATFDQTCKQGQSTLNYIPIRFTIIPIMASACGKYVADIIRKLSRMEEPVPRQDDIAIADSPPNQENAVITKAAIKIQNIVRAKRASWHLRRLQELVALERGEKGEEHEQQPLEENLDECQKLFNHFSPSGKMDQRDFVRLCYDTCLIPFGTPKEKVDFTSGDAHFIFKKIVAKYFDPNDRIYKNGVICGKRFVFQVFQESGVPELAQAKKMSRSDMIALLSQYSGVVRMNGQWDRGDGPIIVQTLSSSYLDAQLQPSEYERDLQT